MPALLGIIAAAAAILWIPITTGRFEAIGKGALK